MCHFYLWKIKIVTYWHFIPLLLRKPSYHQTKLSSTLWSFEVVSSWCEQAGFILVGATVSYVLAHWDAAAFSSVLYDALGAEDHQSRDWKARGYFLSLRCELCLFCLESDTPAMEGQVWLLQLTAVTADTGWTGWELQLDDCCLPSVNTARQVPAHWGLKEAAPVC